MSVKIRLSRIGKKHAPVHRIVAIDSRKKRDGAFLEDLGTYDPLKHVVVRFNEQALQHWISVGAQPSDTVKKIYLQYKNAQTVVAQAPKIIKKIKKTDAPAIETEKKEAAE